MDDDDGIVGRRVQHQTGFDSASIGDLVQKAGPRLRRRV
jgi:hypothetical protein